MCRGADFKQLYIMLYQLQTAVSVFRWDNMYQLLVSEENGGQFIILCGLTETLVLCAGSLAFQLMVCCLICTYIH